MTVRPDAATYFGGRTALYDSRYDALNADGHALRARMACVLRLLGDGPGEILDAGMGPGRLCGELAARGWTVNGIDASDEMVGVARERLPERSSHLQKAKIEALPFGPESFDAVTATGVLEYADVPRALAELVRVLRPGGVAVIHHSGRSQRGQTGWRSPMTAKLFANLARERGLAIDRQFDSWRGGRFGVRANGDAITVLSSNAGERPRLPTG